MSDYGISKKAIDCLKQHPEGLSCGDIALMIMSKDDFKHYDFCAMQSVIWAAFKHEMKRINSIIDFYYSNGDGNRNNKNYMHYQKTII